MLPTRINYQCANNKVLQVQRAGGAAQEKYSDGNDLFYLDGERAVLEQMGRVPFGPCTAGLLPTIQRDR